MSLLPVGKEEAEAEAEEEAEEEEQEQEDEEGRCVGATVCRCNHGIGDIL
jgi:hypothetical protein